MLCTSHAVDPRLARAGVTDAEQGGRHGDRSSFSRSVGYAGSRQTTFGNQALAPPPETSGY